MYTHFKLKHSATNTVWYKSEKKKMRRIKKNRIENNKINIVDLQNLNQFKNSQYTNRIRIYKTNPNTVYETNSKNHSF